MGGFSGSDPAMPVEKLQSLVASGQLRFVMVGGGGPGGGGPGGGGLGDGQSGSSSVIRSLLMDAAEFYVEAELRWLSHIEGELTEKWSKRQERQGGRSARPFALRPGRPSPSALCR